MMDSMFFAFKALMVTVIVVLIMQIKWNDHTLEYEAYKFIKNSDVIKPLDGVAQSTVVFIRNSWNRMTHAINTRFTNSLRQENRPGSREASFGLKRSKQYSEAQEQRERFRRESSSANLNDVAESSSNPSVNNTDAIVKRFQENLTNVQKKVRERFIDEDQVNRRVSPLDDPSAARTTNDDEMVTDDTDANSSID